MPEVLKLAFVGCGAIASYHLNGIRESCDDVLVTAAVDPDPVKAERMAADTARRLLHRWMMRSRAGI